MSDIVKVTEAAVAYRQPAGLVGTQRNASFELHLIAKRANQFRRATWATAKGIADEELALPSHF